MAVVSLPSVNNCVSVLRLNELVVKARGLLNATIRMMNGELLSNCHGVDIVGISEAEDSRTPSAVRVHVASDLGVSLVPYRERIQLAVRTGQTVTYRVS